MRIAFISCPRTPEYLSGTLKSLASRSDVDRFTAGVFFDGLPEQADITAMVGVVSDLYCRTAEQLSARAGWGNPALATVNYMRALEWLDLGNAERGARGAEQPATCDLQPATFPTVACEDDLVFARDFVGRVLELAALASARSAKWVIALHHLYRREEFPVVARTDAGDALLGWPDPNSFYGSQAMVFAPGVAGDLAAMWRRLGYRLPDGRPEPGAHMDMGIKRHCLETGIPLYTVDPCLIQHVGDVSVTIEGREPIRNRYFKE